MREQRAASDGVPVPTASPVPREVTAPGGGRGPALQRARVALIAAADALCDAHDYAGAARTLWVALDRWPEGDPERLGVIDRLARCAEL